MFASCLIVQDSDNAALHKVLRMSFKTLQHFKIQTKRLLRIVVSQSMNTYQNPLRKVRHLSMSVAANLHVSYLPETCGDHHTTSYLQVLMFQKKSKIFYIKIECKKKFTPVYPDADLGCQRHPSSALLIFCMYGRSRRM